MGKKLVFGIDEAGYGPNLGPLCLGASLWVFDTDVDIELLADRLHPIFQPKSSEGKYQWIPLGDSKKLYKSGGSLRSVSVGLTSLLTLRSSLKGVIDLSSSFPLIRQLSEIDRLRLSAIPWYRSEESHRDDLDGSLLDSMDGQVLEQAQRVLQELGVTWIEIFGRVIEEREFNRLVDQLGNKSNVLTQTTLQWIADLLEKALRDLGTQIESVEIYCDKHGGRNRYQGPLTHVFPETWFMVERESLEVSRYRGLIQERETQWSFTAKGDSLIPSSAASMMAKWLREAMMERLNAYWRLFLPNLKATAGYPVDAKRFAQEIESMADRQGFSRSDWWRKV